MFIKHAPLAAKRSRFRTSRAGRAAAAASAAERTVASAVDRAADRSGDRAGAVAEATAPTSAPVRACRPEAALPTDDAATAAPSATGADDGVPSAIGIADGAPTDAPPKRKRRRRRRKAKKLGQPVDAGQTPDGREPAANGDAAANGAIPSDRADAGGPAPSRASLQALRAHRKRVAASRPPLLPLATAKPETNAAALRPNRHGVVGMRGKTDKGRRWYQETDLETAVVLVREHAAVVVNRHTIRRLFSNKAFRRYILTRDNYTCYFCGEYGDTLDHLLPRSKGGHTTPFNCVCACTLCNQSKADRDLDEFMEREDRGERRERGERSEQSERSQRGERDERGESGESGLAPERRPSRPT